MPFDFDPKVGIYIQCLNCGKQLGVVESQPGEDVHIPDHECAGPDQKLIDMAPDTMIQSATFYGEYDDRARVVKLRPVDEELDRWEGEGGYAG